MIKIKRISPKTGKTNSMVLDTTAVLLNEYYKGSDRLVQDIFPNLNVDEREFIMTGYTDEDWKAIHGS
jgi:hypothetical protein